MNIEEAAEALWRDDTTQAMAREFATNLRLAGLGEENTDEIMSAIHQIILATFINGAAWYRDGIIDKTAGHA
jgi:hypothetical protein